MPKIYRLIIEPPILYNCAFTGAVTTRTATLDGFDEDSLVHQVAFAKGTLSSINSYGYSPYPLASYLEWVGELISDQPSSTKPFIISITALEPGPLSTMLDQIQNLRTSIKDSTGEVSRIAIELNTSCPNIHNKPPPAYEPEDLKPLLRVLCDHFWRDPTLSIGLKLPPYVHSGQYPQVLNVISSFSDGGKNPIAFLTCTNTLGSCVMYTSQTEKPSEQATWALPTVFGGLAGEAIHNLALGNVHSFSNHLGSHPDQAMRNICIIGVGGVTSKSAAIRMRKAGATVVAVATALGKEGVNIFERIQAREAEM